MGVYLKTCKRKQTINKSHCKIMQHKNKNRYNIISHARVMNYYYIGTRYNIIII